MMTNKIEMVGDTEDLKKEPRDMRAIAFSGGTVQMTGSTSDLDKTTCPQGVYDKHVRNGGGKVMMTGEGMDLDRTPHRGWTSYPTPISNNSETSEQSVSGYPGSKGK